MTELEFSKILRKALSDVGLRSVNLQNNRSEPACPDLALLDRETGGVAMVELKVVPEGKRRVVFQNGQTRWLAGWEAEGGVAAVIVYFPDRSGGRIWLLHGSEAPALERTPGIAPDRSPANLDTLWSFPVQKGKGWLADIRDFLRKHPNARRRIAGA